MSGRPITITFFHHGEQGWVLGGIARDLFKAFQAKEQDLGCTVTFSANPQAAPGTDYIIFTSPPQLLYYAQLHGTEALDRCVCMFTHFSVLHASLFPVELLNKCALVFSMSSLQLGIAASHGLNIHKAITLPLGVDETIHKPLGKAEVLQCLRDNSLPAPSDNNSCRPFVGFVGRFRQSDTYLLRKRYDFVLQVVERLTKDKNIPVLIAGPGWKESGISASGNLYLADLPYRHYPTLYNMMSTFCSLSLHEGGPIPLLESMACGCVPVITNTGFAQDVLPHTHDAPVLLATTPSIDEVVRAIINSLGAKEATRKLMREAALNWTFSKAAERIAKELYRIRLSE